MAMAISFRACFGFRLATANLINARLNARLWTGVL
jgi:hypothetical protein